MSNTMSNGKSYTDVVLEFSDRLDVVEQRVLKRLDIIAADNATCKERMAKSETRLIAMDERLDSYCKKIDKRIDINTADIKTNATNIVKVRNLNATLTAIFLAGLQEL